VHRLTLLLLFGALTGCRASGAAEEVVGPQGAIPELRDGEVGVALTCAKVVTMDATDRVLNPGMIVLHEGKIVYVGAPADVPTGYEVHEFPELWAAPGMIDLHSHIQSTGWWDTNDMVYPLNADLRVRPALDPWEPRIEVANAAGVTTLFGIPGSGTSIGGFGTLYKTKTDGGFEGMILKDPGGMKSAFNFNPQRGGGDLGSTWAGLTWNVEQLNDRVAKQTERGEQQDWQLENLERVHKGELPVLIHCASAEGVAGTVRTWKGRYDTTCVVSHGSWDGHLAGKYAAEMNVPVNHGPRIANHTSMVREEKIQGGAQAFIDAGVPLFSLNTDAPIVPQEELFLQGSMSARLGADAYQMLQALTINPARSFMIGDRVGSLEVGKDADVLITSGDPLDPRTRVEVVFIDGEVQYTRRDGAQVF
jgi:imidazolonepropionase-like amidohydrolase